MALLFDKIFIKISVEYFNYSNVFLAENVIEFSENIEINKYAIELEKSKQSLFDQIYSLELVKLETLKIYIKTNLVNSLIWLFLSLIKVSILFNRKPNKRFYLCVDY